MEKHTDKIDYYDICRMLKRYSIEEKIRICNKYSRKLMDVDGIISAEKMIKYLYPWELETFLLLGIKASPEYREGDFKGKNENIFINMINGIRNFVHPELLRLEGNIKFADFFIVAAGLIQSEPQEALYYKLYRYSYIFNFSNSKLDMREEFIKKFGVEYNEFMYLGSFLTLLYGTQKDFTENLINYIVLEIFPKAYKELSIAKDEYLDQLDKITVKQEDYIACLRPSYKYPFIIYENHTYLPLPHVIGRSVTSSLLYRITEGNNRLREKIGKEVLEGYLYKILSESNIYDEKYTEQEYIVERHNISKTLDIMLREGDGYLLIDSKSSVPNIGLRLFDEASHQKEIDKLTANVIQVYRHLRKHFMKQYNPFIGNPNVPDEKLWGAVVVLEDSYIRRDIIYEKAAEMLNIERKSAEYVWLQNHIKITNLYDIERVSFLGKSIISDFIRQETNGFAGDYPLVSKINEQSPITNKDLLSFKKSLVDKFMDLGKILSERDIIAK